MVEDHRGEGGLGGVNKTNPIDAVAISDRASGGTLTS